MKKYKLIKEYPGSPKLKTMLEKYKNANYISECGYYSINPIYIENQPEFWEEIIEKDYEILSVLCNPFNKEYIYYLTSDGYYSTNKNSTGGIIHEKDVKKGKLTDIIPIKIHSVKRLSDGEIFTIGDIVEHKEWNSIGTIKGFRTLKHYILITIDWNIKNNVGDDSEASLKDIEHYIPKQPLFTTEDGVDVFVGDNYYELITPDFYLKSSVWNILTCKTRDNINYDQKGNLKNGRMWFSTKEAAEEYILMNKPNYSLNDILKVAKDYYVMPNSFIDKLKQLNK